MSWSSPSCPSSSSCSHPRHSRVCRGRHFCVHRCHAHIFAALAFVVVVTSMSIDVVVLTPSPFSSSSWSSPLRPSLSCSHLRRSRIRRGRHFHVHRRRPHVVRPRRSHHTVFVALRSSSHLCLRLRHFHVFIVLASSSRRRRSHIPTRRSHVCRLSQLSPFVENASNRPHFHFIANTLCCHHRSLSSHHHFIALLSSAFVFGVTNSACPHHHFLIHAQRLRLTLTFIFS